MQRLINTLRKNLIINSITRINMASVTETELKQKVSELITFIRDFAVNADKDFKVVDKREGFVITLFDKDVTVEFSL